MRRTNRGAMGGLSWQDVADMKPMTDPVKGFPDREIPVPRGVQPHEFLEQRFLREIQHTFKKESPFYIRLKSLKSEQENEDGLERYSDKTKPKHKGYFLHLSDLNLDPRLFPEELHSVFVRTSENGQKHSAKQLDMKTFIDFTIKAEDLRDDPRAAATAEEERAADEFEEEDDDFGDDENNDYGDNYFDNGEGDDVEDDDDDGANLYY
ncbi:DNA-directed RNA polymerase III complex subunit Rpc31 [Schizosaccharomyces japonicus yFS275]|uniref:DNA-directed RNA polymerase III subunit n=1 Tax=Schizosaccharomyces japonicus (strain yFS275 / FY16936) TaxID=402676 RepID=B6K632_SCHJY|nr:DNA-directed RNA polymerase III complex subunit Rpc31 [Schizosaccharomyces japonicus yFS275]EEB08986.1 DNA-directed RNA polymerase III complex subunit Rpc31 [Schizosaccharomyces japonicus yFS275]